MQTIDLSIILVSWNTRDLVVDCLASLPAAAGSLHYDVWVVDNGSTDGSVEAIRAEFPHVRLIVNQVNRGFAAANNQAMHASDGRFVFLLNSDTLASPGSIERLVRFAEQRPRAGVTGPLLHYPDGSFQPSFADFPSLWNETLVVSGVGARLIERDYPGYGERHARHARRVDYIAGAAMLVRREALAQVGLMDEDYFMYSEETDWCLRMARAGWETWFCPESQIVHYGGQSTRRVRFAMRKALYRSKVRFFRKHYGVVPALALRVIFLLFLRLKWVADVVRARRGRATVCDPAISWADLSAA